MWTTGDLRKYRNSGAKSNVPKLTHSVSKYKIGQEHKSISDEDLPCYQVDVH